MMTNLRPPNPRDTANRRVSCGLAILLLMALNSNFCHAETFSKPELEAVILYKIMQLSQWPADKSIPEFNIGIYDSSSYITTFKKIFSQQKIRNKNLNIFKFNPYKDKQNIHVLFITRNNTHKLKEINRLLKGKHVLIITDQSNDKRHVMVNLPLNNKSKITFEINRANIILEGIKISNDIVIIGGSELDIAKIYQDTVSDLSKSKDIISKKDLELVEQQQQLAEKDLELSNLITEIGKQQQQMKKQKEEILKDNIILKANSLTLKINRQKLQSNRLSLDKQNTDNKILLTEIANNKLTLINQTKYLKEKDEAIRQREIEIDLSKKTVSKQQSTIDTQQRILIFFIVQIFMVAALIIVLYISYLSKKKSSSLMQEKNQELEVTMDNLRSTQKKLIESEKMASLGGMVKGIAHEINTPAGIVLTASSSLLKKTQDLEVKFKQGKVTETTFMDYLHYSKETTQLSVNNINRVSELVKNFKLVAVDQYSNQKREFELTEYIHEVVSTLHPMLQGKHGLNIVAQQKIKLYSYPGAFSHIISLLVENSLMHAFSATQNGLMEIQVARQDNTLHFTFMDNGSTANQDTLENIFEPFYTTMRSSSCTGLGGHILYNLVTQLLLGSIHCSLSESGGLVFEITVPIEQV